MEIPFSGALTKPEFMYITKLANRPLQKQHTSFVDVWGFLFAVAGILLAFSLITLFTNSSNPLIWITPLIIGLFLVRLGWVARAMPEKVWQANDVLRTPTEGTISNDAIEIRSPNSQSHFRWSDFSGYGEYKDIVLLVRGTAVSYPFPKSFFRNEAEWQAFKGIVAQNLSVTHRVK